MSNSVFRENKKNVINFLSSAELAQRVVKVKVKMKRDVYESNR